MKLMMNETCKDSIITANSVNVNYPVENVIDSRLTRLFKTDANTEANIVFDAGSVVDVSSVCIANHNITSAVTTLSIQGNTTNDFTTPAFSQTIDYNSEIIYADFSTQSYQYWRIQIIDATNPDGFISLGRVWIGTEYNAPGISPSLSNSINSSSVKSITISGQSYLDKRYFYNTISVNFPKITHDEKRELTELFKTIDIGVPFFVSFDEDCIDLTTYYVTLDVNQIAFEILANPDYYKGALSFIEEVK